MFSIKDKKFRPFVSHSAVDALSVLLVFTLLSLTAGDSGRVFGTLSLAILSVSGVIFAMFLFRLYRMWLLVSEPLKRITPKKAAGFMLIPIFNFYWAYIAIKGLADSVNILLEKKEVSGKRVSESLSVAFSIIFPLTFLSLIFARGEVLFFVFFLSMLFIMRRLVWDWRQVEWLLAGNVDESKQVISAVKTGRLRNIMKTVGIVIGTLILSAFLVVWYVSSVIVPFAPYRERGYKHALRLDLKNALTAAQAYLMDYPKATITSEEHLTSRGWTKSFRTVFVSADMSKNKGQIVLKNTFLEDKGKYAPGIGAINAEAVVILPGEN